MKRFGLVCLILCMLMLSLVSCAAENKSDMAETAPSVNGGFTETGKDIAAVPEGRKLIKTFDLSAETVAFDEAISALNGLVEQYGGYVESSKMSDRSLNGTSSFQRAATYRIRIPAEQAEAFTQAVGNAMHVVSNGSSVEDVSETYYTLEATLEELTAERDSLLAMMGSLDEKTDYNFWLTLQQRLSEVKQELAVLQAKLRNYDSLIAYSTVNLQVNEVKNLTEQAESNTLGSRLGAAFRESWVNFGESCGDFVVFLVEAFPTLLVIGGIGTLLVLWNRRVKARKAKRAAAMAEKQAAEEG